MVRDLTRGPIVRGFLLFALPMMAGNLLQQCYNIADTLIVGRALGADALAAVGASYTLMTFLTSIFLGLSMGAGTLFSIYRGGGREDDLRSGIFQGLLLILGVTLALNVGVYAFLRPILSFLRVPEELRGDMAEYLRIIFAGLMASALYNYLACLLRALGNSVAPLVFLLLATVGNVGLDLAFVLGLGWGIAGAAWATIAAQGLSAAGLSLYFLTKCRSLLPRRTHRRFNGRILKEILQLSWLTCLQQSVMNFGILMVQGLVNSFGATIMAAFAAAVKIDTFAYLPVQDFGNAYSTFVAQNFGAGNHQRIRQGTRQALFISAGFGVMLSGAVCLLARPLMGLFVSAGEAGVIAAGVDYLHIEGAFYPGIGVLFLLYGYFRGMQKPLTSVALTAISLGTRVALAYGFSALWGPDGIWVSIPVGWFLADAAGLWKMRKSLRRGKC